MNISTVTRATAVTLVLSVLALAQGQEKTIQRSDLPSAVEKTVAEESKGATIRGFSEERENGKTFYEAELTVNGHSKDMLMDAEGSVVEVEEQVPLESLSIDVRRGIRTQSLAMARGRSRKLE